MKHPMIQPPIWRFEESEAVSKKLLQPLIDDLMEIIANIEVNIDYPEYDDVAQLTTHDLLPKPMNGSPRLIPF